MSGRDQKVQLGARVPKEIRAVAVDAAQAAGVSLNVWLEGAIVRHAGRGTIEPVQISVIGQDGEPAPIAKIEDVVVNVPPAPVVPPVEKTPVKPQQPKLTRFASNCVSGAYHWKHGPGNPCRTCGGEL